MKRASSLAIPLGRLLPGLAPFTPSPRRVVIWVGSFLRRTKAFGHVAQVHADAGPGGGPPSHGIDKYVIDRKQTCDLGVTLFPAIQASERSRLVPGIRNHQ